MSIKIDPIINILKGVLIKLPAPKNISSIWNIGSLLSLCLIIQLISGIILASSYSPSIRRRFWDISILIETSNSWLTRYIHANGASFFFICLYLHIGRGIYYHSFKYFHTWIVGVSIFLLTIATAFLGYVLPINQISFWGASVITNLFSEIPYIGPNIVHLIWGGIRIDNPTISRFFAFHFLLPFIITALTIIHITYLHLTGSKNPLGVLSKITTPFNSFYSTKDLLGVFIALILFIFLCFFYPLILGDNENFTEANIAVTPHHIQPEWYFLFAYAILRSIPNKIGGVIALALSVLILYSLPFFNNKIRNYSTNFFSNFIIWLFFFNVILLTWIGARSVEDPYILTGQILTFTYFLFFYTLPFILPKI